MGSNQRLVINFILALVGAAASIVGFALIEGIAGTVVGIIGVSILTFAVLTNLFNPPGRGK